MRFMILLPTLIVLYFGVASTLPIADVRANVSISFPLVLPTKTVISDKSRAKIEKHVAKIIRDAQKAPFRYGKRSGISSGGVLGWSSDILNSRSGDYTYSSFRAPWYPKAYSNYRYDTSRKEFFPSFSSFTGNSVVRFVENILLRDRHHQMNQMKHLMSLSPPVLAGADKMAEVGKLLRMVELLENSQNSAPLKNINKFYRTSTFTRARPGKRSALLQKMQEVPKGFKEPAVFLSPSGQKSGDASTGLNGTTVPHKKSVALGKGFRRGNRQPIGYN
ncbi:hypothetical protein GCK72_023926 [Caenorhabditis remanei]|uniref:Uncharacterized protein n=1 Tax=Caenorhabditis remanei TaxID=31234 RepID=A0A6A5FYC4_CAERE|nr:hypothetical protein GCK72_023926 [Caenorhabditis remanei]KAF1747464.1 hypothetical protein GCK72_023926 [Caenorhabditis remanei]